VVISISATLLFGIVVFLLWRFGYQRTWPGIVTTLFGFSLASTGAAPGITHAMESVSGWVSSL
jgi:hypothetical protein